MKSGLIVYLAGGAELPEDVNLTDQCRAMGYHADRVELVGSRQGFLEVNDAWYSLFTGGCKEIKLLVARAEQNRLQAIHPPVRLSG